MFSTSYDVMHNDPDRPDIHTFGILVLLGYLGGHVEESSYVLIVAAFSNRVLRAEAEIDDLDAGIVIRIHE